MGGHHKEGGDALSRGLEALADEGAGGEPLREQLAREALDTVARTNVVLRAFAVGPSALPEVDLLLHDRLRSLPTPDLGSVFMEMRDMHGSVSRLVRIGAPMLAAAAMFGCAPSSIGDPCVPESIPEGGYAASEIYIETGSVQCRTRTCMVYEMEGNPETPCRGDDSDPEDCVSPQAIEQQIFCSCRCSAAEGAATNTPLCGCGEGYTCVDDLVTEGGDGVIGGYCVPCISEGDDRNLDTDVFDLCPTDN